VQTNIWQDPYVKSEAVLFLYELDTDAHTAAMMMLQEEEEQGMFGDAYGGDHEYGAFGYDGFGQGGFGNGGTAGAYEIPQSLPSFSCTGGGQSASFSATKESSTQRGAPSKSTATNDAAPLPSSTTLVGTGGAAIDKNQMDEPKTEDKAPCTDMPEHAQEQEKAKEQTQQTAIVEKETLQATAEHALSAPLAHLPISLADIEFLVTPNRSAAVVANRKMRSIEERAEAGGDGAVKASWDAPFEVGDEDEALVCVSALSHLCGSASSCADARDVLVSILRLPDMHCVCTQLLSAKQPSAILRWSANNGAGKYVALIEQQ
jgi:hypothetical protein